MKLATLTKCIITITSTIPRAQREDRVPETQTGIMFTADWFECESLDKAKVAMKHFPAYANASVKDLKENIAENMLTMAFQDDATTTYQVHSYNAK